MPVSIDLCELSSEQISEPNNRPTTTAQSDQLQRRSSWPPRCCRYTNQLVISDIKEDGSNHGTNHHIIPLKVQPGGGTGQRFRGNVSKRYRRQDDTRPDRRGAETRTRVEAEYAVAYSLETRDGSRDVGPSGKGRC